MKAKRKKIFRRGVMGKAHFVFLAAMMFTLVGFVHSQEAGGPLVLQEMTWTDVQEYLKTNDM